MKDFKKRNYNIIKAVLFVSIVLCLMGLTFRYCAIKDDVYSYEVWDDFYKLPKDSLDMALIGGSGIREYYIAPEAYNCSGLASYALATGNQPFASVKYLIEEIQKTQSPQVYIIDIRSLIYSDYNDAAIRRVTDGMKHSKNRFLLVNSLLNKTDENNNYFYPSHFDFYFKFPMYHGQWEDVSKGRRIRSKDVWMGFNIYDNIEAFERVPEDIIETEPIAISERNEKSLRDLLDYCSHMSEKILFINVPSVYGENEFGMFNYSKTVIEQAGFEVLDLNYHVDDMELDYETDFKNYYHVNVWGAIKFTDYFAKWCVEKFELPNHAGEDEYIMWQDNYERFIGVFNEKYCK